MHRTDNPHPANRPALDSKQPFKPYRRLARNQDELSRLVDTIPTRPSLCGGSMGVSPSQRFHDRLKTMDECFHRLQSYTTEMSPQLGKLYGKLWGTMMETALEVEQMVSHHSAQSDDLREQLENLVNFTNRRLYQMKRQKDATLQRAQQCEYDCERHEVKVKLLQHQLENVQEKLDQHQAIVKEVEHEDLHLVDAPASQVLDNSNMLLPVHQLVRLMKLVEFENEKSGVFLEKLDKLNDTVDWAFIDDSLANYRVERRARASQGTQTDIVLDNHEEKVKNRLEHANIGELLKGTLVSHRVKPQAQDAILHVSAVPRHQKLQEASPKLPILARVDWYTMPLELRLRMVTTKEHERVASFSNTMGTIYNIYLYIVQRMDTQSSQGNRITSVAYDPSPHANAWKNLQRVQTSCHGNACTTRNRMSASVFAYLMDKFDQDRGMVDWYTRELINGILVHRPRHLRIELFAKLLGNYPENHQQVDDNLDGDSVDSCKIPWASNGVGDSTLPLEAENVVLYTLWCLHDRDVFSPETLKEDRESLRSSTTDVNMDQYTLSLDYHVAMDTTVMVVDTCQLKPKYQHGIDGGFDTRDFVGELLEPFMWETRGSDPRQRINLDDLLDLLIELWLRKQQFDDEMITRAYVLLCRSDVEQGGTSDEQATKVNRNQFKRFAQDSGILAKHAKQFQRPARPQGKRDRGRRSKTGKSKINVRKSKPSKEDKRARSANPDEPATLTGIVKTKKSPTKLTSTQVATFTFCFAQRLAHRLLQENYFRQWREFKDQDAGRAYYVNERLSLTAWDQVTYCDDDGTIDVNEMDRGLTGCSLLFEETPEAQPSLKFAGSIAAVTHDNYTDDEVEMTLGAFRVFVKTHGHMAKVDKWLSSQGRQVGEE